MTDQELMDEAIKLHKEGKFQEALEKYNTYLQSVPDSKEAHYNKGVTLRKLNNNQEALDSFNKTLELDNNFVPALLGKALSTAALGEKEKALPIYDQIISLDEKNSDAYANKAITLSELGNYQEADECIDTQIELDVYEFVYDALNVDVIGFGALNVDKLYNVANIAGPDGESFIKAEEESPGGSAANTIIGLSKLGCSTSYIGKIAPDAEGDLLEYNLMINNVYLTNLIYADEGNSGKVLGFVSDKGERALYVDAGVNDEISIDEINPLNVNATKVLHYSSFVVR